MNYKSTQKGGLMTFIIILLALAVGEGIYLYANSSKSEVANLPQPTPTDTTPVSEPVPAPVKKEEPVATPTVKPAPVVVTPKPKPVVKTVYKNGTYTADGNYRAPSGTETINVTLVIKNDIIVDSTVTGTSESGRSQGYMATFISHYKSYVTGKNIDSIKLDKVSGSSLTPKGFNDALSKIKVEAKA